MIKKTIKYITPTIVIKAYRKIRLWYAEYASSKKSTEQVFSEIYGNNVWGGERGILNSGSGSDDAASAPYVDMLRLEAPSAGFSRMTLVDLGCGDFRVGRQIIPFFNNYIGVDIVKAVVEENTRIFSNDKVQFIRLNIIEDKLPDGDVCTIRQVLQHLSNGQISSILIKLRKYKLIFITEHYPEDNRRIIPNVDKPHGGGIRLQKNSGVYLSKPPFNLPAGDIEQVLEVRAPSNRGEGDGGIIRTFLYRPKTV